MDYLHYFVLLVSVSVSSVSAKIPDFITVCPRSSPNLEKCIRDSVNTVIPLLIPGIPSLNVPSLEPLVLPQIKLDRGPNSASIKATFDNLTVSGATNFVITELKTDIEKNHFEFKFTMPKVDFVGKYKMRMNILLLMVKGQGDMSGHFTNCRFKVVMDGKKVNENGVDHLQFDPMKIDMQIGAGKIKLDNLFGGDKTLGEITNSVINENTKVFLDEIIPPLEKSLSTVFTELSNKIAKTATYDELFPK